MENSDITEEHSKKPNLINMSSLFILINIFSYLIISVIDKNRETYKSIDENINIYLQDDKHNYYYYIWIITVIVSLLLLRFFSYYCEVLFYNNWVKLIIVWTVYCILSILSIYLKKEKNSIEVVDVIRFIDVIFSMRIMYLFGKYTLASRKKYFLTFFMAILIPYIFFKIWLLTKSPNTNSDDDNNVYDNYRFHLRYILSLILLITLFYFKLFGVRIYRIGENIVQFLLFMYSIFIIGREEKVFSRFQSLILPILLFLVYAIFNYRDFNKSSINVKIVYILGFLITTFLLYIILNTNDKKIKTFIIIFLVIIFNILAIVYGNKGCEKISGMKLIERVLKWTILLSIIVLIIWTDIFQTSIGDNLIELKDTVSLDSENTDTKRLEDRLANIPRNNQTLDERRNIRSKLNEIYEKNIRQDL